MGTSLHERVKNSELYSPRFETSKKCRTPTARSKRFNVTPQSPHSLDSITSSGQRAKKNSSNMDYRRRLDEERYNNRVNSRVNNIVNNMNKSRRSHPKREDGLDGEALAQLRSLSDDISQTTSGSYDDSYAREYNNEGFEDFDYGDNSNKEGLSFDDDNFSGEFGSARYNNNTDGENHYNNLDNTVEDKPDDYEGNGFVDDGTLDDGTVDDGTLDDGTLDDGTLDDGTLDDGTLDDGTLDDGTLDDGTIDDATMDDGTIDDATMDDGTIDDFTLDGVTLDGAVDDVTVGDNTRDSALDDNTLDGTVDDSCVTYDEKSALDWTVDMASQVKEMISTNLERLSKIDQRNIRNKTNGNADNDGDADRNFSKCNDKSVLESLPHVGQRVQEQLDSLPQVSQKVQDQFDQFISALRTQGRCGYTQDFAEDYPEGGKENVDGEVRSILRKPKFNREKNTEATDEFAMISSKNSQVFNADWSQCSTESNEDKMKRHLKESKDEIESLRLQLKEMTKEKQNTESQLEFAKLAIESLSISNSGGLSKFSIGNGQTLEVSNGGIGTKPLRRPRKFFNRR